MADASVQDTPTEGLQAGFELSDWRPLVPLTILIFAEVTILLQQIVIGLAVHSVVFLALLAVVATRPHHSHVYKVLAFVPLLRLLNLGTGILAFSPYLWLAGVYLILLLALGLLMRNQSVSFSGIGFGISRLREQWGLALAGVVLGAILGGVQWVFDLEQAPGDPTLVNAVIAVLVTGLLIGFVEELLFRGLLQEWLTDVVGMWVSVVAVSVLFGFMHSVWFNPADVVFAFVVSILLGVVYAKTRSFWFILNVHALINGMAFGVLPLLMQMGYLSGNPVPLA